MATDREVEELIARCVSTMVFYRNSGKTSKGDMVAEIRAIAGCVREWPSADATIRRIVESVNAEMIARYGHELGVRLDGEFYAAFEGEASACSARSGHAKAKAG